MNTDSPSRHDNACGRRSTGGDKPIKSLRRRPIGGVIPALSVFIGVHLWLPPSLSMHCVRRSRNGYGSNHSNGASSKIRCNSAMSRTACGCLRSRRTCRDEQWYHGAYLSLKLVSARLAFYYAGHPT